MLYWSSLLQEQETKELKAEMAALKRQISRLQVQPKVVVQQRDESEANLLKPDPFYEKTLPELLGPDFEPHGTFRTADLGKPDNLHPFAAWANIRTALAMCNLTVAQPKFGFYEDFAPRMATRVERRGDEFWVFLRDGVYWEPLKESFFPPGFELNEFFLQPHQVTAHDFKFHFDAVMNPHVQLPYAASIRNYLSDIEEFRVVDDLTFVVRWRKHHGRIKYTARQLTFTLSPIASWVWQRFADGSPIIDGDDYRTNSVWAQNFAEHWAKNVITSCGAWLFDGWKDEMLSLRRNPAYFEPNAALFERFTVHFRPGADLIWQDFKGGKIDIFDSRQAPEKLVELDDFMQTSLYREQTPIGKLEYIDRAFRYIGWNLKSPLFENKKVRQALTMAIDRERIIEQNLNGMGVVTTGPLYPGDPEYDPLIDAWPYDPVAARRLLEREGWVDLDGDGVREKNGIPFKFTLMYFVGSASSRHTADYIATALREVGVECKPLGVDVADLGASFEAKDFDAIGLGWSLGAPPSEPKQLWHSSGAEEKGSSNAIGFANEEVDEIITELQYEYDPEKRKALYHRFHGILHDEQPYTFLYIPRRVMAYREYLGNVFIPADEQELIPGAIVSEPNISILYRKDG